MDMVERIIEEAKISKKDLLKRMEDKKKELPGISEDGITRIVAKELGINLSKPDLKELKIASIIPNMRNITFFAKVTETQPAREFQTESGNGKVQNITLEDETGKIRLSLWNEEIDKFNIKEGETLKLSGCRIKSDNLSKPEARLGFSGSLERVNMEIKIREPKKMLASAEEGDDVSVEAVLIDVFPRPILYDFCPYCRARMFNGSCPTHGPTQSERTLILSGIVDDGSRSMPASFFRETAENVLGMKTGDVGQKLENKTMDEFIMSLNLLSKKFKIDGTIRKNTLSNEPEVRVKNVTVV